MASDLGTYKALVSKFHELRFSHTALKVHGIEAEQDFVMCEDTGPSWGLVCLARGEPGADSDVVILGAMSK